MQNRTDQNRCQARTKSGKPCRAAATEGGLCYFHANPNKASELGQIGGRKNRHLPAIESTDSLPKLENASDLGDLIRRIIVELYSGKLHPRVASGLAPLMNLQLRAIEAADLEQRLAKLEELVGTIVDAKLADTDCDQESSLSTREANLDVDLDASQLEGIAKA